MKAILSFCLIIATVQLIVVNSFSSRIAYGDLAQPGQFPYHVLFKIDNDYNYNWCGGALISEKFILTTSECLEIGSPRKAYLGITNITDELETSKVVQISIDPDNDFIFSPNDGKLALVEIKQNFQFSNTIQPVILPSSTLSQHELEGKKAILTGFGVSLLRHADTSKFLRFIEVDIIEQNTCLKKYPEFFDNHFLCSSNVNGKSICFGDQGGPLVIKDLNDKNILIGIAYAQGPFCGDDKWPGVYVKLASYVNWIRHVTAIKE